MKAQDYLDEVSHIDLKIRLQRPSDESLRVAELETKFSQRLRELYPDCTEIHACIRFYNHGEFGDGSLPSEKEMMVVIFDNETRYISINDLTY